MTAAVGDADSAAVPERTYKGVADLDAAAGLRLNEQERQGDEVWEVVGA